MFRPGALILLCAASAALAAPIAPADLFDDIYARSRGVEASLKTLTANFTETTTTAMLSKPVVSHGTLAVVRPGRVVLRYEEPEPHVVLIDGAKMTFSWPSRALVQTTDIGQARKRIDRYFVDKSPAELRRSFKITAEVAADPPHTWRIVMTPTRSQISQGLSRLSLWIDRTTLLMAAMQMDFPNGDSKLMRFDHVQANGTVDPKLFSIDAVTASAPVARSYSAR